MDICFLTGKDNCSICLKKHVLLHGFHDFAAKKIREFNAAGIVRPIAPIINLKAELG